LVTPRGVTKEIKDLTDRVRQVAEESGAYAAAGDGKAGGVIAELPKDELARLVKDLEVQMKQAAKMLEFEKAGVLRDQIIELRKIMEGDPLAAMTRVVELDGARPAAGRPEPDTVGAAAGGNGANGRAGGKPRQRRARYS
jgi:excinuclease ABC subunit B